MRIIGPDETLHDLRDWEDMLLENISEIQAEGVRFYQHEYPRIIGSRYEALRLVRRGIAKRVTPIPRDHAAYPGNPRNMPGFEAGGIWSDDAPF